MLSAAQQQLQGCRHLPLVVAAAAYDALLRWPTYVHALQSSLEAHQSEGCTHLPLAAVSQLRPLHLLHLPASQQFHHVRPDSRSGSCAQLGPPPSSALCSCGGHLGVGCCRHSFPALCSLPSADWQSSCVPASRGGEPGRDGGPHGGL